MPDALKNGEHGRGAEGRVGFGFLQDFDAADLAPAGPLVESTLEISQDIERAFGKSFDPTVVEISDPTSEASGDGLALDEISEADSLHLAADKISAAFGHDCYSAWGAAAAAAFFPSRYRVRLSMMALRASMGPPQPSILGMEPWSSL